MWLSLRTIHGILVIFRRSRRNNSLVQPLPCQSWLPSQLQQKSKTGGAGGTSSESCWVTIVFSQEPTSKIHNLHCFLPQKAARTERLCCPFPPLGSPACAPPTLGYPVLSLMLPGLAVQSRQHILCPGMGKGEVEIHPEVGWL